MNKDLQDWMYRMGFDNLHSFRGSMSQQHIADPTAYERANYIRILERIQ